MSTSDAGTAVDQLVENQYVRKCGEVITTARILCDPTIVGVLVAESSNVRSGAAAKHVAAVTRLFEGSMRSGAAQQGLLVANRRHAEVGVTPEQLQYVANSLGAAYFEAAQLAGTKGWTETLLTPRVVTEYVRRFRLAAAAYNVPLELIPGDIMAMQRQLKDAMEQLTPLDGMRDVLMGVLDSVWFKRGKPDELTQASLVQIIKKALTPNLVASLNL